MENIIDGDFKTNVLKILKELRRYREKIEKMMCEQNWNINKEMETQKETKFFSAAIKYKDA